MTQDNLTQPPRIKSFPDLFRKEALAATCSLVGLCILAVLIDASTGGPVDPSGLPAESVKAPWIFVGIQQMLRYLPAVVAGVALPLAAALIVAVLPFASARRTALNTTVFLVLVVFTLLLTVWGYLV